MNYCFGASVGAPGGVAGAGAAEAGVVAGVVAAGAEFDGAPGGVFGAAGAGAFFAGGAAVPLKTELGPRSLMIPRIIAQSMKSTAQTVVARVNSVAPARAPKAVWLLPPPNALAISPPLPCCSRTTSSSTRQTST